MSKTDKTIPYWVWEQQNPQGWNRRYAKMMYLFSRPKSVQVYMNEDNGSERARLRMAMRDLIKSNSETREDTEFQNFNHRHSALWDAY
jgi:hypothetical protein